MQIRKATTNDARKISNLIRKNADNVLSKKYSQEQLVAWKNKNTTKGIIDNLKDRTTFVAFQNGKLVGTIGLEGNYLVGLYISYHKLRQGIGFCLLEYLENYAKKKKIKELHLTATPYGYGFYLKYGYKPYGKVDLYYGGIKFIETKMTKKLLYMNYSNNIIFQVDAFTDVIFKGNPAAVMITDSMPSETFMQNMAMELNLSETAFVVAQNGTFRIRYFTPKSEIPIAGHPTLASAHILYKLGIVPVSQEIIFEANVATLSVKRENEFIVMNFPQFSLEKIEPIAEFNSIVGFEPVEIYQSDYNWKVAIAETVEEITQANPQFSKMGEYDLGHLMITSKSNNVSEDFVVRCFAPDLGVNEDPVTGSAHCALTPLWAKKLNKLEMKSKQLSSRTGELWVKHIGERVEIKGKAVTVFEAKFKMKTTANKA